MQLLKYALYLTRKSKNVANFFQMFVTDRLKVGNTITLNLFYEKKSPFCFIYFTCF